MMIRNLSALGLAASLALAACGSESEAEQTSNHDGHEMSASDTGHGRGTVVSVAEGKIGIDHGPIDGVGMDAMTMQFGTSGDVDASAFGEGDEVAFMIKRGRDGAFRITAICDTEEAGENCLHALMGH